MAKYKLEIIKSVLNKNIISGDLSGRKRYWTHQFPSVSFFNDAETIKTSKAIIKLSDKMNVNVPPVSSRAELIAKINSLSLKIYKELNK